MTYQTKKQLREALQGAKAEARALRDAIHHAGFGTETVQAGWMYSVNLTGTQKTLRIGDSIVSTQKQTNDAVGGVVKTAQDRTRREALEKVIEALELTEYGYHKPGAFYYGGYTNAKPGHERLWSDIQTALEHREAEKRAETQRKTAERVAGLTKKSDPARFFVFNHDESYGSAQTISKGDIQVTPRKSGKSAADIRAFGERLGIRGDDLDEFLIATTKLKTSSAKKRADNFAKPKKSAKPAKKEEK